MHGEGGPCDKKFSMTSCISNFLMDFSLRDIEMLLGATEGDGVSILSPSLRRPLFPQTLLCGRLQPAAEETSWQFEKQKQKLVGGKY